MTLREFEKHCNELLDADDTEGLLVFMDEYAELQQRSFEKAMKVVEREKVSVDVDAAYQRFLELVRKRSS